MSNLNWLSWCLIGSTIKFHHLIKQELVNNDIVYLIIRYFNIFEIITILSDVGINQY